MVGRALERSRNLAVNLAIIQQARVATRLHMLLWHFADRWGRVRADGVLVPLALTHAVLAELVAARRPTVTTALTELARAKNVRPADPGWLLEGEPPGELLELQTVSPRASGRAGRAQRTRQTEAAGGPGAIGTRSRASAKVTIRPRSSS